MIDVPPERFLNDVLHVIDANPCRCGFREPHGHLSEHEVVTREAILAAIDRVSARRAADHLNG